jgi:hypothetical protein
MCDPLTRDVCRSFARCPANDVLHTARGRPQIHDTRLNRFRYDRHECRPSGNIGQSRHTDPSVGLHPRNLLQLNMAYLQPLQWSRDLMTVQRKLSVIVRPAFPTRITMKLITFELLPSLPVPSGAEHPEHTWGGGLEAWLHAF